MTPPISMPGGKSARFFIGLIVVLTLLAVVFSFWGHDWIRDAYQNSLDGHPSVSFIDHNRHDLDHYLHRADLIFWQFIFLGIPLTILFWILLYRLTRKYVSCQPVYAVADSAGKTFRGDSMLAFGLYALLTLIYFWPLLSGFGSQIIGPPADNMGGYWNLWFSNELVFRGAQTFAFTNYLYYPEGTSMYYFAWSFYNAAISFVLWMLMSPEAVFNVIMLHTYPLAGLGAFLLVRRVTGNSLLGLIGGFIFAFSPNHFARSLHHANLTGIQFIPFFVLYFIEAIREGGWKNLALASLFFLLCSLCDWNYMVMGGYFIAFGYLYLALKQKRWILPDYLSRAAIVVGSTVALTSVWLWGMVQLGFRTADVESAGRNTFVVDLVGLFAPGEHHWLGNSEIIQSINSTYSGYSCEFTGYLGIVAIIIVLITIRHTVRSMVKYWFGFFAFTIMALGPQIHILGKLVPVGLPYTVLAFVPFLSNVRAPGRFIVFVYLFWAIIVSHAVKHFAGKSGSPGKRTLFAAVVAILLFADYFSVNTDYTKIEAPTPLAALQSDGANYGILNLPLSYGNSMVYMMQQTIHRIPSVDGSATRKIGQSLVDHLELNDIQLQKSQLIEHRIKYIAIHKNLPGADRINIADYLSTYSLLGQDANCTVLRVF